MDEMIQRVVSSHFLYSPYVEEKIRNLETKPILHSFDVRGHIMSYAAESDYKFVIWSHVASLLEPLIKPLVIFSSSIPSFFDLNWDDRLMCLKLRFFEIWIIHASRLANCDHGTMTFSNGCYVSKHQLEIIYDGGFVAQLLEFAGCLKDLQLSDTAIALYSAVVLYSSDTNVLKQPKILQRIQEKYKIYLSYQLHVHDQQPEAFDILLSMLPELQDLGRRHLQYVKQISSDICPHAEEPMLLIEVFNFIKEEDVKEILNDISKEKKGQGDEV